MKTLALTLLLAGCSTPSFLNQFLHPADMSTDSWWKTSTKMLDARQETAAAALGTSLLVLGGLDASSAAVATVDSYDPSKRKWSSSAALPEPLYSPNAAVVGTRLYVLGALGAGDVAVGRGYVYDGTAWSPTAPMPAGTERGAAMVAAFDGVIYVAGGLRAGAAVDDFAAYDTAADSWRELPSLPVARDHGFGAAVSGVFFAIGGRVVDPAAPTALVHAFDTTVPSGAWSAKAPLPTPRSDGAVAGSNTDSNSDSDTIIVIGGQDADGALSEAERYSPALDRWSLLAPMPTARHGMGAATLSGLIYVAGGGDSAGVEPVTIMETLQP